MEEKAAERLKERLLARSFPRLQMVLILSLAGIGAFFSSVALLHSGLYSMAARYFIAAAFGYLLFLTLVRLWLLYQRRRFSVDVDVPIEIGSGDPAPPIFSGGGGTFGGGGASGSYGHPERLPPSGSGPPDTIFMPTAEAPTAVLDSVSDLDEAWPAAVVGAVYRRARRRHRGHWLRGVVRRTWLSAAALCVFSALAGFVLQASAPEARSLGGVFQPRDGR